MQHSKLDYIFAHSFLVYAGISCMLLSPEDFLGVYFGHMKMTNLENTQKMRDMIMETQSIPKYVKFYPWVSILRAILW